ncbi:MAG TPA: ABC transporter permease [Candidatus Limnocylindrales bacterium]
MTLDVAAPANPRLGTRLFDFLLDYGLYVALLVLVIGLSIASPFFLTVNNLLNVGQAIAIVGIIAAAMTIAMIAGQLDLTVGSIVGLTAVITAHLIVNEGQSILVAAIVSLIAALAIGVVTGVLVVNVGINSIIATLALGLAVRGLAFVVAEGQQITIADPAMSELVYARPLGIPVPVFVMAIIYTLAAVLMYWTKLGWHLYAVGGNESAARRAGIPVDRLKRLVFLITSGCAALAGLILTARASSGIGTYGTGLEFNVLTAVLLGGIGLAGGSGRIERTLAGVVLIGILTNGLTLINMPFYYQQIVYGIVFVAAVVLDAIRRKRRAR